MIGPTGAVRVMVATKPVDFRKGAEGLAALVRDPPSVVYVYAPDRKAERSIAHLAGFRGILQVDGYGGYKVLAERGEVRLALCWSHVGSVGIFVSGAG